MKIYIKTTESCQLKCKHCYIGDFRQKKAFFNEDKTIKWLQDWIKLNNFNIKDLLISFHGGEPFLCDLKKMQKVVDAFPEATFDATTNLCYELTLEKINFIKKNFKDKQSGRPFIKTSWDWKIRFVTDEQLNLWIKNFNILKKEGVDIKVIICLTSTLIKDSTPIGLIQYLCRLGINYIDFERLTENTTSDKDLIPNYEEMDKFLYDFYKSCKKYSIRVGMFEELENVESGLQGCRKRKCMEEVVTINADGSIGGCPNTSLISPFSNIDGSPKDLLNNKCRLCLIQKERTWKQGCYVCELFKYCNGDCHQLSWKDGRCAAPKKILMELYGEKVNDKRNFI